MFYLATVFFSVPFGLVGSHDIAFPPHCCFLVIHYTEQRKCSFSSREVSQPFSLAFTLGGGSWALALGSGSWRSGQISALMFSFGIPFPNHLPPPTSHPLATKHSWNLPPATDTHCHGHRWKCQISVKKIVRNSQTYNDGNMGYPKPFHMRRKTI